MNEPITWGEYFRVAFTADALMILAPLVFFGVVWLCKYLDNDGKKWFKDKEEDKENE